MFKEYYESMRKGGVIQTDAGFLAYSRFRSKILTIEHMYNPNDNDSTAADLIHLLYLRGVELGCTTLEVEVNLRSPNVFRKHRTLVQLGFYPIGNDGRKLVYERGIGAV